MGGHDAMMQAQRFPEDFDGIVARAPAGNIIGPVHAVQPHRQAVRNPAGMLNPAKQKLLANAVLAQCDGLDGLADGIISKPAACNYDPTALRCAGGADTGDSCLSDAQIATVKAVTTPIATNGRHLVTSRLQLRRREQPQGLGRVRLAEPDVPRWRDCCRALFSDGFIRSFITRDPNFDTSTWDANQWMAALSTRRRACISAFDPDLSRLEARGAKLIMWNGTTDTSVSPKDTSRYYERVVETLGREAADDRWSSVPGARRRPLLRRRGPRPGGPAEGAGRHG